MKDKVSHGGAGITLTKYEVREIDEFGDAQDVDHYDCKREAMKAANQALANGARAVVVELHKKSYPSHLFSEPSKYKIIATMGNAEALKAGGWEAR